MILYSAADLLWASKIRGTAEAVGLAARPVRTLEMLEARLADSPVRALVADLDAAEIAMMLIARLRDSRADDRARNVRILAFGPHVAIVTLQQAKAAGADTVMARGAFAAKLPQILKSLDEAAAVQDDLHD